MKYALAHVVMKSSCPLHEKPQCRTHRKLLPLPHCTRTHLPAKVFNPSFLHRFLFPYCIDWDSPCCCLCLPVHAPYFVIVSPCTTSLSSIFTSFTETVVKMAVVFKQPRPAAPQQSRWSNNTVVYPLCTHKNILSNHTTAGAYPWQKTWTLVKNGFSDLMREQNYKFLSVRADFFTFRGV